MNVKSVTLKAIQDAANRQRKTEQAALKNMDQNKFKSLTEELKYPQVQERTDSASLLQHVGVLLGSYRTRFIKDYMRLSENVTSISDIEDDNKLLQAYVELQKKSSLKKEDVQEIQCLIKIIQEKIDEKQKFKENEAKKLTPSRLAGTLVTGLGLAAAYYFSPAILAAELGVKAAVATGILGAGYLSKESTYYYANSPERRVVMAEKTKRTLSSMAGYAVAPVKGVYGLGAALLSYMPNPFADDPNKILEIPETELEKELRLLQEKRQAQQDREKEAVTPKEDAPAISKERPAVDGQSAFASIVPGQTSKGGTGGMRFRPNKP